MEVETVLINDDVAVEDRSTPPAAEASGYGASREDLGGAARPNAARSERCRAVAAESMGMGARWGWR